MSSVPGPEQPTSEYEFMSHYDSAFGFLLRRIQKRSDAEDLAQDTVFRFLHWGKDRSLPDSKRMLFKIVQNLSIDRSRWGKGGARRGKLVGVQQKTLSPALIALPGRSISEEMLEEIRILFRVFM